MTTAADTATLTPTLPPRPHRKATSLMRKARQNSNATTFSAQHNPLASVKQESGSPSSVSS